MYDYEDDSSEYDEDLGLMKKALDVDLPEDFDPNKVPQNGHEYIQKVMYEARLCEKLVVAKIDKKKVQNEVYEINVKKECVKAPNSMLPTHEWQETQVQNFTDFRKFIATQITKEPKEDNINPVAWAYILCSTKPKLSSIQDISQNAKIQLLQVVIEIMEGLDVSESIQHETGVWLYSILATLELPLCPHSCHVLRDLARICSVVRSRLPENCDDSLYVPLNLYICLVSRYFRQLDLVDQ